VISALRLVKDEVEVKSIRHAVEVAERALQATLSLFLVGMTERELAAELVMQLLRAGSESEFPFSPIVASGPNSAIPHATPTDRAIQAGDLLIMDWGAKIDGYVSDITRTFAIGDIDPEFAQIYRIVTQANAAGRDAIRPEITCGEIDHAAREIIEAAKFGDYFLHRTGHGIGMEGHEPPYIQAGSDQRLIPGMTFTVEPGIYLPDRGGVRIEDDMLVTEDGGVSLTTYPRELEVIP
jgi:Xaa-Pro dipeptidase